VRKQASSYVGIRQTQALFSSKREKVTICCICIQHSHGKKSRAQTLREGMSKVPKSKTQKDGQKIRWTEQNQGSL